MPATTHAGLIPPVPPTHCCLCSHPVRLTGSKWRRRIPSSTTQGTRGRNCCNGPLSCLKPALAPEPRKEFTMSRTAIALIVLALSAGPSAADDWPQWMGPHRDNVWREDGILDKFPAGGPKVV